MRAARAVCAAVTGVVIAGVPAAASSPPDVSGRIAVTSPASPLVYVIVVDGLDGDLYDAGRLPTLRRLVQARGTYYQQSRAIMVAETNPNHTAMMTGAYADSSGIPANDFALYSDGGPTVQGCPVSPGVVGPARAGLGPACVTAETVFQSTAVPGVRKRITSAGIFGKPKLATLFAARRPGGSYAADYMWTPCTTKRPDYCRSVPLNAFRYADDGPTMDALLRAVRKGVRTEQGRRRTPNLTFVNLPTVDTTGHLHGTRKRYRKAAAAADAQLDRFVRQQKRLGLWDRTVLMVLSDHSMATTDGELSLAQRFDAAGIPADDYVIVANGGTDFVYLTDRGAPSRFDLLRRMRSAALAAAGVDEALFREPNPADGGTAHTLAHTHPDWRLAGPRTGDLIVTARDGGAFAEPTNLTSGGHGSPGTLDNLFTVTGGWPGIADNGTLTGHADPRFEDRKPDQAQTVDVAPTVLWLLGLPAPRDSQGRVLTEAFTGR